MKVVAVRILALAAVGGLLAGCASQPGYDAPPSPETQANQACNYLGEGPGTPVYRTCYQGVLKQFQTPQLQTPQRR